MAPTKLIAFTLSAFVAGLGGALFGLQQGRLSYGSFGVSASIAFLAAAYIGGIARISGALIGGALVSGGVVFTALERLGGLGRYGLLIDGLALIAIAVLAPDGLAAIGGRRRRRREPRLIG